MRKRAFLGAFGAFAALAAAPARAQSREFTQALGELAGTAAIRPGRVQLEIPRLADNGYSVPVKVRVEAAATPGERVASITLLSDRNPRPVIATFSFGPRAGPAVVSTRVRLNGTQNVTAIARFADGSLWSASVPVEVTESACLDMS